jgi:hypothetical protein
MEVSGQLHAPAALPPEIESPVPIRWTPEPVWTTWSREKCLHFYVTYRVPVLPGLSLTVFVIPLMKSTDSSLEMSRIYFQTVDRFSRSQWPRCLMHGPSLPTRTLGSWVRIPLETWMSVRVCCVFMLFYV